MRFDWLHPEPNPSFRLARMRNTSAVVPSGGGAPSSASPASTPAASTPAAPATTPATPTTPSGTTPAAASQPATPVDDIRDGDWRQLRTRYDEARNRTAILDKIGSQVPADQLEGFVTRWSGIQTEATTLAKDLGFDDADFKEAFETDPVQTLAILRAEKAKAASRTQTPQQSGETDAAYEARIQAAVDKATKPITDHINKQISDQVTTKIGTEFETHFKAALPDAPTEVRQLVEDYVIEALTHDNSAIVAMKARGDYGRVKEIVDFTTGRLKSVFAAWVAAERTRATGRPANSAAAAAPAKKGFTLDDIINDPSVLGDQYK